MDVSNNACTEKFDVWLFAIDLINFVFLKSSKLQTEILGDYSPNFVCNGFSEVLKNAVQSIKDEIMEEVEVDFADIQQRNGLRSETFEKYAEERRRKINSSQLFDAGNFLYYCVQVAFMAYRFQTERIRRAQILAALSIAKYFQGCETDFVSWEAFDDIARRIVGVTADPGSSSTHQYFALKPVSDPNPFGSPETEDKEEEITRGKIAVEDSVGVNVKEDSFDPERLSSPKPLACDGSSVSSRQSKGRMKRCSRTEHKILPSLNESLESSIEQLSISSKLPLKLAVSKDTSTPADLSPKWKSEIQKPRTPRNSLERQIFKLSPIRCNRVKSEGSIRK